MEQKEIKPNKDRVLENYFIMPKLLIQIKTVIHVWASTNSSGSAA